MKKRLVVLLIISLLVQPLAVYGQVNNDMTGINYSFNDIKGHWAEKTIKYHNEKGRINGYADGTFKPDNDITVAEVITLFNSYLGLDKENNQNQSTENKEWYDEEVAKAKYYGYIEKLKSKPEDKAERIEVLTMMSLLIDYKEEKARAEGKDFKDLEQLDKSTRELVKKFSELGYINGYKDDTFKPTGTITRAEILTVLDNAVGYIVTNQEDLKNIPTGTKKITIINENVTIENLETNAEIYISPGVEGNIKIKNCKINGQIMVSGGTSEQGIEIENTQVKKVIITKSKEVPRVEIKGNSSIEELKTKTEASIEISGETKVTEVKTQAKTELKLDKGTKVKKLVIEGRTKVETEKGSKIENLEAKEKVEIKGQGTISKAEIKSEGVTIEKRPDYIKVDDKVDNVEVGNDKIDHTNDDESSNKGGSSSSSGGSSSTDTIAPDWAIGYPFAQMKTKELEMKIFTKLNEKATVYYTVYGDDTTVTVDELINSGKSISINNANTVVEEVYNSGLESGKTYNVYLTAVDRSNNKQNSVKKIQVSEIDTTAPIFTKKEAKLGDSTEKIKLTVETNEIGTIYYIVVEDGNEPPTVKQVKSGNNYNGTVIVASGNKKSLSDEVISGLTEGKKYDIYIVAEDESGNISDTVSKINIETKKDFGSGTESDPYKIYTIEDLASIGRIHPGTNKEWKLDQHYILMNDLNFANDTNYTDPTTTYFDDINSDGVVEGLKAEVTTGKGWKPTGGLSGCFSGNDFTISNLYINRKSNNQGLFSKLESGSVVKNLGIIDSSIKGIDNVGALAGKNMGLITDSYASASVTGQVYNMSLSLPEVQAARVASFSTLYDGVARQPEFKNELIAIAKELTGELGDASSPEVQAARVASFSTLYEAIARQPELKDELIEVAKELTGELGDTSSSEVQSARITGFGGLYEAIARQPETKDELLEVAKELTGELGDVSSPEAQAARVASFDKLYEAIGRKSELKDELLEVVKELTGELGDTSSSDVQAARITGFSGLYKAISRRPELKDELIEVAKELTGELGDTSSSEIQAARITGFSELYEAISRRPELKDELIEVAKELTGELGDTSSPEVQAARVASFDKLYEAIGRRPELKDELIEVAKELTGELGDASSPEVQSARIIGFRGLYKAIARQPELKDELIEVAKELTGEFEDTSSSKVQSARVASFSTLYEAIARQPELKDELIEVAKELTGELGDTSSPEVQAARVASFDKLYEGIARQPEFKNELIAVAKELTGELVDVSSPEVQAARVTSFSTLYESITRLPEAKNDLIEVTKELTGELLPKVRVGGLVGINSGTITSSYTTGDVIGGWYVGGIVGYNEGRITDSYAVNTRLILASGNKEKVEFGRIVGCNISTLKDNYANKDMEEPFKGAFNLKDKTPIGNNGGNLASWDIDENRNITVVIEN
ncbi:S-layer homology domain-containing protein [Tepidibacter sp. Z1-5]|uniref:S-layer homology domain-containing protein n=1 Tax=Tepidibacter sp. Z1-5 TaxID=3134138 RepID=UPI0030C5FABA